MLSFQGQHIVWDIESIQKIVLIPLIMFSLFTNPYVLTQSFKFGPKSWPNFIWILLKEEMKCNFMTEGFQQEVRCIAIAL